MYVTGDLFDEVLTKIARYDYLSLDTETTGLRPYHGDRLFSIIIGTPENQYYFNFFPYPDENALTKFNMDLLQVNLFDRKDKHWFVQNAKFDMAMLYQDKMELKGTVYCTATLGRIDYNEHFTYGLDARAKDIGFEKDPAVEQYVNDHKLWDTIVVPGTKKKIKRMRYQDVPKEIIVPYGERDAEVTFQLGKTLLKNIDKTSKNFKSHRELVEMEARVTKACFDMERIGVKVNLDFCAKAAEHWSGVETDCREEYLNIAGKSFTGSWQTLSEVFKGERSKWVFGKPTKKKGEVNPKFDNDVLQTFDHPLASTIQKLRDAKSKADFFHGFIYHADSNSVIHPNWNQFGTTSGRFSSSEPNFQNLKKDQDESSVKQEYIVRRAIVPRPDHIFIMPDYDQVEYRLMLDYAAKRVDRVTPLVQKVLGGLDVHTATRDVVRAAVPDFTRKQAKAVNFGILYGQGLNALSQSLRVSKDEALRIKNAVLGAAPEIKKLIGAVERVSKVRGYIFNWNGRKLHCPDSNFAYKMPNRLIQGGSADITKMAMVEIAEYLKDKKSNMLMTIHDELVMEVHKSELRVVPRDIKDIMETCYSYAYVPLTVGMCWSATSLADKQEGFPPEA